MKCEEAKYDEIICVLAPVVVEDTEEGPHPAEDDESVDVAEDHHGAEHAVDHQQHLAQVEAEPLVADVVQHQVRQRGRVRYLHNTERFTMYNLFI